MPLASCDTFKEFWRSFDSNGGKSNKARSSSRVSCCPIISSILSFGHSPRSTLADGRSDENLAARVVSAFLFGFGGLYPCLCLLLQCLGLFELVLQILDSLLCFLDVGCHDYPLRFYPGILYR